MRKVKERYSGGEYWFHTWVLSNGQCHHYPGSVKALVEDKFGDLRFMDMENVTFLDRPDKESLTPPLGEQRFEE